MTTRGLPRSAAAALVVAAATLVVACGSDGPAPANMADRSTTDTPSETVLIEVDAASNPTDQDVAARVLKDRIELLGVEAKVERRDNEVTISVEPLDEALVRQSLVGLGRVEFRPVLERLDLQAIAPGEPDAVAAAAEAVLADVDGGVLRLGPTRLTGAAIEGASVRPDASGQWSVNPVLLAGAKGIDAFNDVAAECYDGNDACPALELGDRGQLAVVLDGVVLLAPTINVPRFERDEIQITGDFSETDARALAVQIGAGESPVAWTVRD